jgi:serine/threonine protein kinase
MLQSDHLHSSNLFEIRDGKRYFGENLEVLAMAAEQGSQGSIAFVYNHTIKRMETLKIYRQEYIRTHELSALGEICENHYPHFSMVLDSGMHNHVPYLRLSLGRGFGTRHQQGSNDYSLSDFLEGRIITLAQVIYNKNYSTDPRQQRVVEKLSHAPTRAKLRLLTRIADILGIIQGTYGIVHNDIKPEHILLLAPEGHIDALDERIIQVIDFGNHIRLSDLKNMSAFVSSPGTFPYSSPEAMKTYLLAHAHMLDYSPESLPKRDMYSFGVMGIHLLAIHPYLDHAIALMKTGLTRILMEKCLHEPSPDLIDALERERARVFLIAQQEWLSAVNNGTYVLRQYDPSIDRRTERSLLRIIQSACT